MPKTGIPVSDDCFHTFMDLQMKNDHKFIVFVIRDKEIQVETVGGGDPGCYEDFLNSLPTNECRYAVYKMSFTRPSLHDGLTEGTRTKTVFVSWVPESVNVKEKFIYTASKSDLKHELQGGLNIEIVTGKTVDLTEQQMLDRCIAMTK